MKRLSLQWRITIMTALLTCAACVLTNCLVGYTGMRYMDAIGSDISAFTATGADSPQAFDPTQGRTSAFRGWFIPYLFRLSCTFLDTFRPCIRY